MKSVIQWYKRIAVRVRKMPTILAIIVAFSSSGAAIYGQGVSGVPAIPLESGVQITASPTPAAQTAPTSGPVAASYETVVSQPAESAPTEYVPTESNLAINPTGPFEKRGDYYVRTTDRYGNPKYDFDEYSPGILPQPMGGMPNSGPERIDPRTLQPSGPKGAAGNTILNSPGCQLCGGGYGNPRLWSFEFGVKILHREAPEHIQAIPQVIGLVNTIPNITGYSIDQDNSFDIAPGLDIRAKRYLGRNAKNVNFFLEFEYWGLNEWELTDKFTLWGLDATNENQVSTVMEYKVRSRVHSFELNLRVQPRGTLHDRMVYLPNGRVQRQCRQGWSGNWLVGIRYFDQNDFGKLSNLSSDLFVGAETDNNMLGFQLGLELVDQHCMWNWGVNGKIAPLYNWSDRTYTGTGINPVKAAEGQLAGLADVGAWINYRFSKRWTGRFQYNVMWITGVAQATNQMVQGVNDRYAIDNDTTEFMQGLTLSLEYAW